MMLVVMMMMVVVVVLLLLPSRIIYYFPALCLSFASHACLYMCLFAKIQPSLPADAKVPSAAGQATTTECRLLRSLVIGSILYDFSKKPLTGSFRSLQVWTVFAPGKMDQDDFVVSEVSWRFLLTFANSGYDDTVSHILQCSGQRCCRTSKYIEATDMYDKWDSNQT